MNVSQKVVTVTGGGGSGCGRAIAATFAEHGAAVVVSDINDAGGHETIRLIEQRGGRAAFLHADVGNELQAQMLIEFAESKFGSLSVLVNNASSPHPASEGLAGWIGSLQTDLLGAIYATRWAIEAMRRSGGGSIVNISSISALWHGRKTPGGFPGYDVAKLGVIRLTTGLAKDVAKEGITCQLPGTGLDRVGGAKTVLGIAHPVRAQRAWGTVKAACDAGDRPDGTPLGLRRIVKRACRLVVVGGPATPHSVGRPGLP